MSHYTIRDLEKLSGIKAHTLRIWEKRYDLLKPCRTQTNIRYYTNTDLKRILNIALLNRNGYKISRISGMTEEEISRKVAEITNDQIDSGINIDNLVIAATELDGVQFEKIINTSVRKSGFEKTVLTVIYPFMKKIGILWQTGAISPAQEHFVTNLIRKKMILAIDGIHENYHIAAKQFLLFLPEGEWHELGLLFYHYLIKKAGHQVIYLGQSVPLSTIKSTLNISGCDYLVTSISTGITGMNNYEYLKKLSSGFSNKIIIFSVFEGGLEEKKLPPNFLKIENSSDFNDFLHGISIAS